MSKDEMSELDGLREQLNQARQARRLAEQIADEKTIKLYQSNKELRKLTEYLEEQVKERTSQLEFTNQYLRQLSKEQRRLIDDALAPIFIVDRQGCVTEWNGAMERLTGVGRQTVLNRNFVDACVTEDIKEMVAESFALAFRNQAVSDRLISLRATNGQPVQILTGLTAHSDANGEVASVIGVGQDVTSRIELEQKLRDANEQLELRVVERTAELKAINKKLEYELSKRARAEHALHENEEQFRGIVELAPNGILTINPDGQILMTNTRFVSMIQGTDYQHHQQQEQPTLDPKMAEGQLITRYIAPNEVKKCMQYFQSIITGEQSTIRLDTLLQRIDSEQVPVEVDAGHCLWNGKPSVQIIIRDITERYQMEAALYEEQRLLTKRVAERTSDLSAANAELARVSRMKDEFLASMSHELRTPLNAILGLSEALQEEVYGTLNEKQSKTVHNIEQSGRHLLALISDILDVSKIEAGKFDLLKQPTAIDSVCQSSLNLIKQDALKKDIKLSYEASPDMTWIYADERRLKQILVNLLSNAVKFTHDGGAIGIEVVDDKAQDIVHFTVWDTGIGISVEDSGRLFQPFVQLDSRLTRYHPGTGLGLALVYKMTELHGGSVSLESEVGEGSRFTISLPKGRDHREEMQSQREATQAQGDTHRIFAPTSPANINRSHSHRSEPSATQFHPRPSIQRTEPMHNFNHHTEDGQARFSRQRLKATQTSANPPTTRQPVSDSATFNQTEGGLPEGILSQPTLSQPTLSQPTHLSPLILLAEDNEANITTLSTYLGAKGYRLAIARNGAEAVEQAMEMMPDIILMDIQMPEMDGLEATKLIREEESMQEVPIIALTALAMPGDRERCIQAGTNEYLSKPVSLRKLQETIEQQLSDKT
ncbi:MAG: ATP-binding protein [Chloroflexota bacterium]